MQQSSGTPACPDAEVSACPDGTVITVDLAEVNFGGYSFASSGRSLATGEELPDFEAMPEEMRRAWAAGARAVVRHVVRHGELTQALSALRRLADPAALLSPDLHEIELHARIAYAAKAYARLATAAGQLGLDDDAGAGRPAYRDQNINLSLVSWGPGMANPFEQAADQRGQADDAR